MRTALILLVALLIGATGCARSIAGQGAPSAPSAGGTSGQAPASTTSVAPPASPVPAADGNCPYLTSAFVADANGQRVTKVKVSRDDPPACFFYRADGKVQLTVQVYVGDPGAAKALVDQAAPVATANPAELPSGWAGGAQSSDTGAVFAVAKAGAAVVITTNQAQTIKAKRVAEETISALAL